MNVRELIETLSQLDPDLEVVLVRFDEGSDFKALLAEHLDEEILKFSEGEYGLSLWQTIHGPPDCQTKPFLLIG